MSTEPTTTEKIAKLPWSIGSNAANTVFVQFTYFGSVFVLFLNELGLSKSQIGFLLSLFPFFGLIALFIAPTVARYGYKRTFVTFFGLRMAVTGFLLFTPMIVSRYGSQAALIFVSSVAIAFALCRAIAETARFPWIQEFVPRSLQGKYSASNNMFSMMTGFVAVLIAGFVIGRSDGLSGFMLLIGIGVGFGLLSDWAASHIPGGAAKTPDQRAKSTYWDMLEPFHDRNFMMYLLGAAGVILAVTPLNSFVPLFMREQVGIASGNVILLQNGTLLGGLISTFLWGWAADRYGSKPIMVWGVILMLLPPIAWLLMPRGLPSSLYIALAIAFMQGIINMAWAIGSARMLFVNVVPPEQKTEYMALYYAWVGVFGGISQLLGGQILELSRGLQTTFMGFSVDPFTPLFLLSLLFALISWGLFQFVRSGDFSTREFAGLFFRGNPFMAVGSLISYHMAKDEQTAVSATERLGRSRITVEELLASLKDPRFNVRFEAIISIARTKPDPRLTEALIKILGGTELSLTVVAAWALGRVGDEQAIEALRKGLKSDYRSVRAHCARALATLSDFDSIDELLIRFRGTKDKGLRMAYGSALGKLQAKDAIPDLLVLLDDMKNPGARMETALAISRIVGEERNFIRMERQMRDDAGTAAAQSLTALRTRVSKLNGDQAELVQNITDCADAMAKDDLPAGCKLLSDIARQLAPESNAVTNTQILDVCADRLLENDGEGLEYLILSLHTLSVAWKDS